MGEVLKLIKELINDYKVKHRHDGLYVTEYKAPILGTQIKRKEYKNVKD